MSHPLAGPPGRSRAAALLPAAIAAVLLAAAGLVVLGDAPAQAVLTGTFTFATPGVQPDAIAADDNGNIWFTAPSQSEIGRVVQRTSGSTPTVTITYYSAVQPDDITYGPDGNLWFTVPSLDEIGRITQAGVISYFSADDTQPDSISPGNDGDLWFAAPNQSEIGRITTSGVVTLFSADNTQANAITAGPGKDGDVMWFTAPSQDDIGKITETGAVTLFPAGLTQPDNIIAATDGNLWFTAPSQSEFGRITPAGSVTLFPGDGQPHGIAQTDAQQGESIYLGEPSQDDFEVSSTSGQVSAASSLGTQVDNITDNEVSGVWWTAPSQDELGEILIVRAIR